MCMNTFLMLSQELSQYQGPLLLKLEYAKREIDTVESYASNCSDFSLQTLYEALDIFAFAHFWGWLWVQIYAFEIEIQVSWLIKWVRLSDGHLARIPHGTPYFILP